MSTSTIKSPFILLPLLAGITFSVGFGSASTADKKVREGLAYFDRGDFDAASEAFAEADVARPEDDTIMFDRACAIAAAGDVEKARDLFRQAALARDTGLAARAHYNLGNLAAGEGRATLGEDPLAADPDSRQQAISLLLSAVAHYRDCLRLDQGHDDARYNLELIRLFIKHVQAQWDQHDREKAREEMGLLEFLAFIEKQQRNLRSTVQELDEQPDSPQRRQLTQQTSDQQAELMEEIEPLKQKIA